MVNLTRNRSQVPHDIVTSLEIELVIPVAGDHLFSPPSHQTLSKIMLTRDRQYPRAHLSNKPAFLHGGDEHPVFHGVQPALLDEV